MKNVFPPSTSIFIQIKVTLEWFRTKTRFETEAKVNSEMVYCIAPKKKKKKSTKRSKENRPNRSKEDESQRE